MDDELDLINKVLDEKRYLMTRYSEYGFYRDFNAMMYEKYIEDHITSLYEKQDCVFLTSINNKRIFILYEKLEWDSKYFGMPSFRLHYILTDRSDIDLIVKALYDFIKYISAKCKDNFHIYCQIPCEDILILQSLCKSGWSLIETRLTYYKDNIKQYNYERFPVRQADAKDIDNLMVVASSMKNIFDRFHADPAYSQIKADSFLATYIKASVNGFADYVMVPDEGSNPPDAFLTSKYHKEDWEIIGNNVSKMVLSAVSSKTRKGWYLKLISEMIYHFKSIGVDIAYMHPSSANMAVIHTYEKLGCKLGQCKHIFSFSPNA